MTEELPGKYRDEIAQIIISAMTTQKEALKKQWDNPEVTATRHFILDGVLPDSICRNIYTSFPSDLSACRQLDTFRERKKTLAKFQDLNPVITEITYAFQNPEIISLIEEITGMNDLEADPRLYAGGISIMEHGDFLNPHIDNSHDSDRKRYRRLNLLYYVSPDWTSSNGGNLELWDSKVKEPREIVSRCNRLVVMETTDKSWHSVNPVISDRTRCCVTNYYFSQSSPSGRDYYHVTSFLGRPDQPVRRIWGKVDNSLRQAVATLLGISRGMEQMPDISQSK